MCCVPGEDEEIERKGRRMIRYEDDDKMRKEGRFVHLFIYSFVHLFIRSLPTNLIRLRRLTFKVL